MIVPIAAGGGLDAVARFVGRKLAVALNQTIIVDNRPGGAQNIGIRAVAKAVPDGYTLLYASNTITINPAMFSNLGYDANAARTGQVTLRNTILGDGAGDEALVSDRSSLITPAPNLGTASADVGERNIVRGSSATGGATVNGTPLTGDPLLGPLGNNGGPTPTMAPAANSPAIDAGAATLVLGAALPVVAALPFARRRPRAAGLRTREARAHA